MKDVYSLNHTVWECKYHIVWIPIVWANTEAAWRGFQETGEAERK